MESLENCIHTTKKYREAPSINPEDLNGDSYTEYVVNAASQKGLIRTLENIEKKLLAKNTNLESVNEAVLAVSEIIQNAQEHSCKFSPNKEIYVSLLATQTYVLAGVGNSGTPLSNDKARELIKRYDPNSRSSRGRGFEILRRTTDVIYIPQQEKYSEIIIGKILE